MAHDIETTAVPVDDPEQTALAVMQKQALTKADVTSQAALVHDVMKGAMVEGVHYGVIPGTKKPSLLQPGAEKLCLLFRLAPIYTLSAEHNPGWERDWDKSGRSGTCKGFLRHSVTCRLIHSPTGATIAEGVGTANNWEPKFISRDPYEVEETILQFARKRALVNAARTATAASDIFTQDEDLIPEAGGHSQGDAAATPRAARPARRSPPASPPADGPAPSCPECGAAMENGRGKSGKGPLWRCTKAKREKVDGEWRDTGCNGVYWHSKDVPQDDADAALDEFARDSIPGAEKAPLCSREDRKVLAGLGEELGLTKEDMTEIVRQLGFPNSTFITVGAYGEVEQAFRDAAYAKNTAGAAPAEKQDPF